MTIKQFLEKQTLDSGTKLRFQFTDRYDVGWNFEDTANAKSSLKNRLIDNFSCDLQRDESEPDLYIFNLNLNKIPENLFTTFFEIYEQPSRKSEGGNVTVREYLNELQKRYSEERQPRVFFRQKIFMKDFNEKDTYYNWLRFDTQNSVSLEEAVNGSFSHLFVDNVETRDDIIWVDLITTAKNRGEELEQQRTNREKAQEEADKKLNVASDIFFLISIVVGVIIGVCLGFHIGGDLGFVIGILCAFSSGLSLWAVVESILKATGKIVSEDGKLKFKRK